MEAIVLAGGLGRRLRSVVPELPKPMAPVNGRPFLEYLFDYWIDQDIRRLILSVGYRRDVIQAHFGESYRGTPISYAVEDTPLGTGGALLRAMTALTGQGPFIAINGDTYFEVDLADLERFHVGCGADMTLALRKVEDCNRYTYLELDERGRIAAFHARGGMAGAGLINGGVYLATKKAFEDFVEVPGREISLEDDVFPHMLSGGGHVCGYLCHGRFIDIGVPDDYRRAASLLGAA